MSQLDSLVYRRCERAPDHLQALVIYGHSLDDNDRHILRLISRGGIGHLLVSIYGDPKSGPNKAAIAKAQSLARRRDMLSPSRPLVITFYDAASARVWG